MNASPLVLSPSGNAESLASQSGSATQTSAATATGDGSTFAGALQSAGANNANNANNGANANPTTGASNGAGKSNATGTSKSATAKPGRKAASKGSGDSSGGALPLAGNQAPHDVVLMPVGLQVTVPASAMAADAIASGHIAGTGADAFEDTAAADVKEQVPGAAISAAVTSEMTGAASSAPVSAASTPLASPTPVAAPIKVAAITVDPVGAAGALDAVDQPDAAKVNGAFGNLLGVPGAGASAGNATAASGVSTIESTIESTAPAAVVALPAAAAIVGGPAVGRTPLAASRPAAAASLSVRRLADTDPSRDTAVAEAVTGAAPEAAAPSTSALAMSPSAAGIAEGLGASTAAAAANPSATAADATTAPTAAGPAPAGPSGIAASTLIALAASHAAATVASAQSASALTAAADKHAHSTDVSAPPAAAGTDADAGIFQLTAPSSVSETTETATPTLQVHANVDSADFAQGLSERVSYMVDHGLNGAKLQVNPPQLGPIELRIAVTGGHAQVWMTTHSAVTRDALESSSPKLREMLGAQGFGQVSVDISQRSFQDRSTFAQPYQAVASAASASKAAAASVGAAASRPTQRGLDAYA